MATVTISPDAFPPGTTVALRPRTLKNEPPARRAGAPHKAEGAATASGTTTAAGLTLAGATSGTDYWAVGTSMSPPRWVAVRCP